MAADLQIIIDGYAVKEIRCKNDICRKLIGYENIKIGVFIHVCPFCEHISIFNMRYKEVGKELIDQLQKKFNSKGGE